MTRRSESKGVVLLVGDRSPELVRAAHALESIATAIVATGPEAFAALGRVDADLIVADERVGGQSGDQFLEQAASVRPAALRILLAGDGRAFESPASGTTTVLARTIDQNVLLAVCAVALRCAAAQTAVRDLRGENERLRGRDTRPPRSEPDEPGEVEQYEGLLTRSPAMQRGLAVLRKIEGTDAPVLICGATGTGKELVARAIHARSRRGTAAFATARLEAASDRLQESLLFGHVRGAFAGAVEDRAGLFPEADGGCLFLDEVSEASPALQVALLRVLEEGVITPVGSDRARRVDVRIMAATTRNLRDLVRTGFFRQDLYYRLSVFSVDLPPLRERPEDIYLLATHFLAAASLALGKKPPAMSREARAMLEAHRWEGNVRELRNVMERAAVLCRRDLLVAGDLPLQLTDAHHDEESAGGALSITIPASGATLKQLEREIFLKTLTLANGNQSRAARILGLRESTLRFRLRKLGIASRRVGHARSHSFANGRAAAVS